MAELNKNQSDEKPLAEAEVMMQLHDDRINTAHGNDPLSISFNEILKDGSKISDDGSRHPQANQCRTPDRQMLNNQVNTVPISEATEKISNMT